MEVHIRWLIRRDMADVLEIEQASFNDPWTEKHFLNSLSHNTIIGMVAEHGVNLLGFMLYDLRKASLRLLNFAVHSDYRRQGVGRQMVEKLTSKLSPYHRTRITLAICDDNLEGQLFFRAQGFQAVKVLRNYYNRTDADAYLMVYRLSREEDELSAKYAAGTA